MSVSIYYAEMQHNLQIFLGRYIANNNILKTIASVLTAFNNQLLIGLLLSLFLGLTFLLLYLLPFLKLSHVPNSWSTSALHISYASCNMCSYVSLSSIQPCFTCLILRDNSSGVYFDHPTPSCTDQIHSIGTF